MIGQSLQLTAMEKAIEGLEQRKRLISDNIANIDTPGYKSKKIDFESALAREISYIQAQGKSITKKEANARISAIKPETYQFDSLEGRLDENNVDIDLENIEFARAQLHYDYLVARISSAYSNIKYAISGGR